MTEFVFMLTHNDSTVADAVDVLDGLTESGLSYIGFKDVGPPPPVLAEIASRAHDAGMEVMLEIVSTDVDSEVRSLRAAKEIGVDWVLGGTQAEAGVAVLDGTGIRYCPFPGRIEGHPSVLRGTHEEIVDHARRLGATRGVYGLDLLAYRHETLDPLELTRDVVSAIHGPVIVAGSVATLGQIDGIRDAGAWGFTIGGAIFEGLLPGGDTVAGQVAAVLEAAGGAGAALEG
jgi:DhnA family fructose-bisphosphate aldolase class Ia